ncbi:MAG: beta-propeller fold lactonase family protein, partial [Vicinamibacterales bacterium]
ENQGAIAVFDAKQQKFLRLITLDGQGNTPKPRPMGIAVAPDGSTVYVTTGSFSHLFFIDPAKNAPSGSTEVGQRPWGIALMPGGKTAYTANGPSNDVSLVDLTTRQVVKKIAAGNRPWGVAIVVSR